MKVPTFCALCTWETEASLRRLYTDRKPATRVRPPARHGHHLYRIASTSSLFFYWAPDRQTAAMLSRTYGDALKGQNLARRATYSDIGLLLGTIDQKAEKVS